MTITPQAIKDQEFQVKFRGYDPIEVKAYLDLIAEEFFELHEGNRRQTEAVAELDKKYQELFQEREELLRAARDGEAYADEIRKEQFARESALVEMQRKTDRLEGLVSVLEQEKADLLAARSDRENELSLETQALQGRIRDKQDELVRAEAEAEQLRQRLAEFEKQVADARQDEQVFKSTIIAAQSFAEDLRKKAEQESRQLMDQARHDVETYRRKAEAELAGLPVEIERLNQQRLQARDELRAILQTYLANLDAFGERPDSKNKTEDDDLSDLFQSITLPDDALTGAAGLDQISQELGLATDKT